MREVLVRACDAAEMRIELPAGLDEGARFDFLVTWPDRRRIENRERLLLDGIEVHFGVEILFEPRSMDVYVLTAPGGIRATQTAVDEHAGGAGFVAGFAEFVLPAGDHPPTPEEFAAQFPTPESLRDAIVASGALTDISGSNATIEDLCRQLETGLGRLVVDETNLEGRFDVQLHGRAERTEDLIAMLRDQLGLVLTPAQRQVSMLVVRRRSEA